MDPGKNAIKWEHLMLVHEIDKKAASSGHLLICPKITRHHFELNSALKMRVRLALQVNNATNSVITKCDKI